MVNDPKIVRKGRKVNGIVALHIVLERMGLPEEEFAFYRDLLNKYTVKPEDFHDLSPSPDHSFLFKEEDKAAE